MRLVTGELVWCQVAGLDLQPLDPVGIGVHGERFQGVVVITPGQIAALPWPVQAQVLEVRAEGPADTSCDSLPGDDLPALGQQVRVAAILGQVVALDVPAGMVTIRGAHGDVQVQWTNLDVTG